jgi:hypothetical protein
LAYFATNHCFSTDLNSSSSLDVAVHWCCRSWPSVIQMRLVVQKAALISSTAAWMFHEWRFFPARLSYPSANAKFLLADALSWGLRVHLDIHKVANACRWHLREHSGILGAASIVLHLHLLTLVCFREIAFRWKISLAAWRLWGIMRVFSGLTYSVMVQLMLTLNDTMPAWTWHKGVRFEGRCVILLLIMECLVSLRDDIGLLLMVSLGKVGAWSVFTVRVALQVRGTGLRRKRVMPHPIIRFMSASLAALLFRPLELPTRYAHICWAKRTSNAFLLMS